MNERPRHKKYEAVSLSLQVKIRNGEYQNSLLPSESELCRQYGVGRNTIRHALRELETRNLLSKSQGRRSQLQTSVCVPSSRFNQKMAWLTILPHAAIDDNQHTFDLFRLLSNECNRHGVQLDFISLTLSQWAEYYAEGNYQAAFLSCCRPQCYSKADLERLKEIPNLITLEHAPQMPWHYSVSSDHHANALRAVRHLLSHGHRRIGFFCSHYTNRPLYPGFEERRLGYEQALREAGIPLEQEFYHYLSCNNLNFMLENLQPERLSLRKFDAIFAVTDLLAVLLVQLAREVNIKVPEELSIIGIDGWEPAQYLLPRISTIRHSVEEIALQAFRLAQKLYLHPSGKERPAEKHIRVPGALIPGETVCDCINQNP